MTPRGIGGGVPQESGAGYVMLSRVYRTGRSSFALILTADMRREMGLVERDVIAFRVYTHKGKRVMIGEKVPMHALANMRELPDEIKFPES